MIALKDRYKDSFLIGNIYKPPVLQDEGLQTLIKTHFNSITAENIMKPLLIQPERGRFTFEAADQMMAFAKENRLVAIGHTLVWHNQSLNWIDEANTSKEEAIQIMKAHMEAKMGRYKGKIQAWDVLNEAFNDGVMEDTMNWRNHLRDSKWLRMIGPDYVEIAFKLAHEIDPEAILYYNDYNLNHKHKREVTYHMVKELREKGIPIHGIGEQGHYNTNTPIKTVEDSLALFSQIPGIILSITELDVTVTGTEKTGKLDLENEIKQAQHYAQLFKLFKAYDHVIERVTFWGTDDKSSWRTERFPTIFNADYSPKLAFDAIMNPEAFLEKHPPAGKLPQLEAVATYGEESKEPFFATRQMAAWEGPTAEVYAKWTENSLSFMALIKSEFESIDIDVTMYVNTGEGVLEYRVALENNVATLTVPTKIPLTENQKIGFDIYLHSNLQTGSIATWNGDDTYAGEADRKLGLLTLIKEISN